MKQFFIICLLLLSQSSWAYITAKGIEPHQLPEISHSSDFFTGSLGEGGLVGVIQTGIHEGQFSVFNEKNGTPDGEGVKFPYIFQQGIGAYCPLNEMFYAPIQLNKNGKITNHILAVNSKNGKYELSEKIPFIVYTVQGFGHSLAIDKSTCDVYVVGRSSLPAYNWSHVVYRYNEQEGLQLVMELGDKGFLGECMVSASAFDPQTKRLWILQQLGNDDKVNLHVLDLQKRKNAFTVDNSLGFYTLNFDEKSRNLYSLVLKQDYQGPRLHLIQINADTGAIKDVMAYDEYSNIIVSVSSVNDREHELYVELGQITTDRFSFVAISLDNFKVSRASANSLPYIMASAY